MPRMTGIMHASNGAHMPLSCRIRGSGSAWESWWVASEAEHCEGYEWFRSVEPERDSCEQPDLCVGGFNESLGEVVLEVRFDRVAMFRDPLCEVDERFEL